jgi:hypothetical protein
MKIFLVYPEDRGSNFLRNIGPTYQTAWCHTQGDRNFNVGYIYIELMGVGRGTDTAVSLGSSVVIATAYVLDDRGAVVRVPVGSRIFTSLYRPDWLWAPPSLLENGYWGLFLQG